MIGKKIENIAQRVLYGEIAGRLSHIMRLTPENKSKARCQKSFTVHISVL
jgi:hypothetical protein